MSLWKRGRQYWTDFTVNGRRYRKRLGTTNLRVATRRDTYDSDEAATVGPLQAVSEYSDIRFIRRDAAEPAPSAAR